MGRIVRRVLEDAGIAAVETARTAEAGLRIFRKGEWDLVLLDYRLPGSSGLEALDQLRKIDPDVPAIVLKGVIEAGKRLLQSVPADSVGFDSGQPASARRQLVAAFAQLYRAVRMYGGGLPGVELNELCRVVGSRRLSARQIAELHALAMDQVVRDEWRPRVDLASRLNEGLLLAVLWLNDGWTKNE